MKARTDIVLAAFGDKSGFLDMINQIERETPEEAQHRFNECCGEYYSVLKRVKNLNAAQQTRFIGQCLLSLNLPKGTFEVLCALVIQSLNEKESLCPNND